MVKITSGMRRMATDPAFYAAVKQLIEAQDNLRAVEHHRMAERRKLYDELMPPTPRAIAEPVLRYDNRKPVVKRDAE